MKDKLPQGWEWKKLGEVAEIVTGGTPSKLNNKFFNGPYKWVKPGDLKDSTYKIIKTEETLSEEGIKECRILPKGSVLVTCIGTLGKVGLADEPLASNQQINSLIFNKEILPEYGYFFCKTLKPLLENMAPSTTVPIVNKSRFGSIKICFPPLPEQIKIASILEKADILRQKRKQAGEKLDTLLQSVFLDMFGDPVSNPKGWEIKSLGSLGNWRSGGTPSRSNPKFFQGNIPWLSSGELEQLYTFESKEHITEEAINSSSTSLIETGSLLLGMYDTAALKSTITKVPLTCNQAIAYAKLNSEIVGTEFIYFNIQYGKEHYKRQQRGVRQKNLNLSIVKELEIPLPPLPLQNEFAAIVEKVEAQKARTRESQAKLDNLFNSLMQKAFSGELEMAGNISEEIQKSEEQLRLF